MRNLRWENIFECKTSLNLMKVLFQLESNFHSGLLVRMCVEN